MGEAACDLLTAELALDRLDAALATELPAHVRAFAAAHAAGTPAPPPPPIARRPASLADARRALAHPVLADRALALLRVLAPIAIDDDPHVAAARAADRTWANLARLTAARDAAAHARVGLSALDLVHRLHGSSRAHGLGDGAADDDARRGDDAAFEPLAGWDAPCGPLDLTTVQRAWRDLAARHGARGTCTIAHAPGARPRAFVVEPRREVTIVIGALATPAARFAVLHELGHAVAALAVGAVPRVVDEAVAAYAARLLEAEGALDLAWFTPLATAARARRLALAARLDAIERGADPGALVKPPWALWHDAGAQAAYVAAETLADRCWAELGAAPDPGALAALVREATGRIDRDTMLA